MLWITTSIWLAFPLLRQVTRPSCRLSWEELKKRGREDILVCIGGVIPAQDYQYLYDHGAQAIFGPGTNIPECCIKLLHMLVDRAEAEAKEG
ncbi:hypothetical protein [Dialister invisus]|uniref:hypothetical protein n=1 Tax=Dialister invisus TaxID=218538 RepID=UPI0039A2ADEE